MSRKKIIRGDPYKKNLKKYFFFLKIIKNCLKVIFNQLNAVLEKFFKNFLRFGKKIIGVPVV